MTTRRFRSGFTLLELLVVVFLLSALALSGVAVVDDFADQARYDDTSSRLMQLRYGILGPNALAGRAWSARGFVADNGLLPEDIEAMLRRADDTAAFAAPREPIFAAGGAVGDITLSAFPLAKGWRGPYLVTGATRDPGAAQFRDGWSNRNALPFDDAAFHGWVPFDSSIDPLLLRSPGANGIADDDPAMVDDYEGDLIVPIGSNDWSVSAAELAVTVSNGTTGSLGLRAVVLVWVGDAWSRVNGAYTTVSPDAVVSLPLPDERVPIGTHLVVLVAETNGTAEDGEVPYGHAAGALPLARRVLFASRTGPEPVTWEVR